MNRREFVGRAAALCVTGLALGGCAITPPGTTRTAAPTYGASRSRVSGRTGLRAVRALPPGGCVALVAPSSPVDAGDIDNAVNWLAAHGFTTRVMAAVGTRIEAPFSYLGGTDSARRDDLHTAFAAPDIDAVWCMRGGFGAWGLLDRIDYGLLRAHPKPFIGYSDITSLHAAIHLYAGFVTFHGPMLTSDLVKSKQTPTETSVMALIQRGTIQGDWIEAPSAMPLTVLTPGAASGRLVGGNLTVQCSLLGTPYEEDYHDAILFIEDISEIPQRLDRLLTQLSLAGKLATLKGVLIGDFAASAGADATRVGVPFEPLFRRVFAPLNVPVLAGWPSGHCDPNLTLPLGAQVRLDTTRRGVRLEQPITF